MPARREKLEIEVPEDLQRLTDLFAHHGRDLYLVGGAVRDAVLGKAPKDWDVATSAPPEEVARLLRGTGHRTIPVGAAFGVVRVITPEGNEYEVATFRTESGYSDGRRPDQVSFSGIEDDVRRRDLTMNALFYDLASGEVVDYVGGLEDLRASRVKAVGDPEERFREDRLRILRVLRFVSRMGGTIDPATLAAIKRDPNLQTVSPERIREEFFKGIESARDLRAFLDLVTDLGLWEEILPGLRVSPGISVPSGASPVVVLALLLQGNSPERVKANLNSLKYTAQEASGVAFLLKVGKELAPETAFRLWKLWAQARSVSPADLRAFQAAGGLPEDKDVLDAFIRFEPSVSGQDLMNQGFQGKALGQELERLETERFREMLGLPLGESMAAGGGGVVGGPLQNLLLQPSDDENS